MADEWNDEKQLIEAAQAGDQPALTYLFNCHFSRLYRYMLARTGNTHDAEDMAQEVFLRVLDALPRYEWRDVPFTAWLFRIAHNIVVSRYRRNGLAASRSAPFSDDLAVPAMGPEQLVEARLSMEQALKAAERLAPVQRQVIELRLIAGLTVAETAQVLGKTENNVKVVQHKAIARLRRMLVVNDGEREQRRDVVDPAR